MTECYTCGCPDKHKAKGFCRWHYSEINKERSSFLGHLRQQRNRKKRTEYFRKYRQTEKGKSAVRRAVRKYESLNPDRKKAWGIAHWGIYKGKINNKPCSVCGSLENIHKHHPDILEPLEVIFLCPLHHKQVENEDV